VKSAAIHGQDGAAWARSDELKVTPEEVKALVAGLKEKDNKTFLASGIVAGGVKYMFLKGNDNNAMTPVIGRKGPTTVFLVLSKKAIIITLTKDGANPGNVTSHQFVADDLAKKGF